MKQFQVTKGRGDWAEGKHWLDQIVEFRSGAGLALPLRAGPGDRPHARPAKKRYYPGTISNVLETSAMVFLNPAEAFVNAHLSLLTEGEQQGERPSGCLLFNENIGDGHFSALGAEVWAETVAAASLCSSKPGPGKEGRRVSKATESPPAPMAARCAPIHSRGRRAQALAVQRGHAETGAILGSSVAPKSVERIFKIVDR